MTLDLVLHLGNRETDDVDLAVDFLKKDGVVDYLTKPVEKDKLIAAVEQAAQGRKLFE